MVFPSTISLPYLRLRTSSSFYPCLVSVSLRQAQLPLIKRQLHGTHPELTYTTVAGQDYLIEVKRTYEQRLSNDISGWRLISSTQKGTYLYIYW